jgi:hypothetical protein
MRPERMLAQQDLDKTILREVLARKLEPSRGAAALCERVPKGNPQSTRRSAGSVHCPG